jgi:hypothetical protein
MGRGLKTVVSVMLVAVCLALVRCEKPSGAGATLVISGPVHVYPTEIPPSNYPRNNYIAELGPKDRPAVLEVKSGNGYRVVRVRLADGREGWVFSGEPIDLR